MAGRSSGRVVLEAKRSAGSLILLVALIAFALVAVVIVIPSAMLIANAVAAGPAHAATRISPATALRTE